MRRQALVALVVIGCGLLARAETPPHVPRTAPVGFAHAVHAGDVAKSGAPAIACVRCHAIKAGAVSGKPGHTACFGACHGPAPAPRDPVAEDKLRLCNPCHAETALLASPRNRKALAVAYPPYALAVDHSVQLGHKAHAAITCAQCHDKRGGPPHKRCIGCHDGTRGHAMTACLACHPPGTDPPRLEPSKTQIVVTSAFSHARHATRGAARQCIACHAPVVDTNSRELPRPAAATCALAGCHDGKAAFGITAACTKCHKDAPKTKFAVARPDARFSHFTHDKANLGCRACHPFSKSGEVLVSGHAPCVSCHAPDFGERDPKICGACHHGTEPWRPLVADRLPSDITEFGVTLAHDKHPGACTSCHSLATSVNELRPPRGHVACTTSGCHAITGGPAPQLTACEGCHMRGVADARERARLTATWSVRATFVHAPHRAGKTGELACTTCHTDMSSPTVLSLAVPAKQTCASAGCHDGQGAFKVTGTSCTRCHLGARR
jgi:c(7)-type cytochrome triheme protein